MPTTAPLTWSQKAAAVLLTVGPEVAATVLRHFDEAQVEQIAMEVATLGDVDATTMTAVLDEFKTEVMAQQHLLTGGEHHARELLRRLHGTGGDDIVDRILASVTTAPFYFLRMHEPDEVVKHLRDEHPQTIALVLAHLPARFAASILAELDPAVQSEVARRVATMEASLPEVVTRVEAALRERIGEIRRRRVDRDGVRELAGMLNESDRTTERLILGQLDLTDPDLAERVRALMFVFEDIAGLDDRTIQELLRQVDLKHLALALKGVGPQVRETFERNLSERARQTLVEEAEALGPVRRPDVEQAQTTIVQVVQQLERDGVIQLARAGQEELLV